MDLSPRIHIPLRCPASLALHRIAQATTREGLPFLSPFYPRDKPFLSRIDGIEFRIWKWPSRHREPVAGISWSQYPACGVHRHRRRQHLERDFSTASVLQIASLVHGFRDVGDIRPGLVRGSRQHGARLFAILFLVMFVSSLLFAVPPAKIPTPGRRSEPQVS